ncbi:hypothetical protein PRK78_005189 [Emydomyces testavorans]|uniref:Uncharacterized protein n=1 Tax=Emydomyces testavorans TaxID=2070801 RepID=A0AAF0DJ23_9EURO|nr:hypothetical protein PRK78_005189 [Emydomyces testavorans]
MKLKEIELTDEKVEMINSDNEKEKMAENADSAIENFVHQHEQNADSVTADKLLNLDDFVNQIAENVKQQLLKKLQEDEVKK